MRGPAEGRCRSASSETELKDADIFIHGRFINKQAPWRPVTQRNLVSLIAAGLLCKRLADPFHFPVFSAVQPNGGVAGLKVRGEQCRASFTEMISAWPGPDQREVQV